MTTLRGLVFATELSKDSIPVETNDSVFTELGIVWSRDNELPNSEQADRLFALINDPEAFAVGSILMKVDGSTIEEISAIPADPFRHHKAAKNFLERIKNQCLSRLGFDDFGSSATVN